MYFYLIWKFVFVFEVKSGKAKYLNLIKTNVYLDPTLVPGDCGDDYDGSRCDDVTGVVD